MSDKNSSETVSKSVKQYGKQLFSFIRGKVKSIEDAEDVLQDVWYQLSNLSSINELENIGAWLYFVSRNKITDLYRKKKNSSLDEMGFENEEGEITFKEILLLDDSQSPELALFKEIFWKELMIALNELPENQKSVFILNEMEDKTLQEIANLQGENIKTIISRKGYAVKHLRSKLNHLYQELNQ